jgi:hypothetical protein
MKIETGMRNTNGTWVRHISDRLRTEKKQKVSRQVAGHRGYVQVTTHPSFCLPFFFLWHDSSLPNPLREGEPLVHSVALKVFMLSFTYFLL